ncbi:MAG: 2 protein [Patescibacteria group bacterium]|nr:2 protein [Patescibacteria group bacterium]
MHALTDFMKRRPIVFASLLLILILASYFRLWRLNEAFHFMGDQGRDALIVSRIFTQNDLVFVGPVMSVGNIYLGPLYYYFMLPFLMLSYPSPVGPVYAVAIANILAVFFLFQLGKKLVGERASLFAAAMMAVSVIAIVHSRFSWNPNIIPLVSIFLVVSSYYALIKNPKYWIVVAACLGLIVQLHYVTLLSGAAAGVLYIYDLFKHQKVKKDVYNRVIVGVSGLVVIGALLSPLILFDMRHDWLNVKALQSLATDEKNFVQADQSFGNKIGAIGENLVDRSSLILFDKVVGKNEILNPILILIVLVILVLSMMITHQKKKDISGISVLMVFLIVGIVGFSFYEKDMYDHYIAYLFPLTFLVLGYCLDRLVRVNMLGWIAVIVFFVAFAKYNLPRIEFKSGGPTQEELQIAAESIHSRVAANEPYAIVLLSESKDSYGMNYRYFLNTVPEKKPVDPDRNGEAQKLFIINEERKTDRPQDAEIYEIVTFGQAEPSEVYTLPQGIPVAVLEKNRTTTP